MHFVVYSMQLQAVTSFSKFCMFSCRPIISRIVTGYLPNLILQLSLKLVPPVMEFLSSIQGYISYSEIQRSACDKFLWFIIWNIFFTNVLSGSFLNPLFELLDLRNIPEHLAVAVPAQVNVFYLAYLSSYNFSCECLDCFVIQFFWLFFSAVNLNCNIGAIYTPSTGSISQYFTHFPSQGCLNILYSFPFMGWVHIIVSYPTIII